MENIKKVTSLISILKRIKIYQKKNINLSLKEILKSTKGIVLVKVKIMIIIVKNIYK